MLASPGVGACPTFPTFDVPCVVMLPVPQSEYGELGVEDQLYVGCVADLARQVEEQHELLLRKLADEDEAELQEIQQAKDHEEWVRRAWWDLLTPTDVVEVDAVEVVVDECLSQPTCVSKTKPCKVNKSNKSK